MAAIDRLHRATGKYKWAVSEACQITDRALAMFGSPVAVAVSGGKDSVAMAHLVCGRMMAGGYPKPILLHTDSGLELKDSFAVCERLADMLGASLVVAKGEDARALKREMGAKKAEAVEDRLCIVEPTRRALKENGIALEFVGLRMAESRRRHMLIGKMGPVNRSKKYGCGMAWPMKSWSGIDVFAYIDLHGLPLHPAYSIDMGIPREDRRVSWSYDSSFENKGAEEFLRRYDPVLYQQLKQEGILCTAR